MIKPSNISQVDGETDGWRYGRREKRTYGLKLYLMDSQNKLKLIMNDYYLFFEKQYGLSRKYMNKLIFVRMSSFSKKSCRAYKTSQVIGAGKQNEEIQV